MSSWPNSSGLLYPTRSSPTRDVRVWLRHNRRAMKTYSARHSNRVAQCQIWNPGVEKSLKSMICTHALLVVTVMGVPRMEPEAYQTNVERDMRLDSSRPRCGCPKRHVPARSAPGVFPASPHSHTTKHSVRRSKEGQKEASVRDYLGWIT